MTATTTRAVESREDVADEEQRLQWEAWAASYESFGLTDDARRVRAMNTPQRRAAERERLAETGSRHGAGSGWEAREPSYEAMAEAAAVQWDLGRDAEDPWAYDRYGMHGGAV